MHEHDGHKTQAYQVPDEDDKPQGSSPVTAPDRQHDGGESF